MYNSRWLFWGLVALACLLPFSVGSPLAQAGLRLVTLAVLLLGARAIAEGPGGLRLGLALALPAAVTNVSSLFFGGPELLATGLVCAILFQGWLAAILMGRVLRETRTTSGTVYSALVVYQLVGVAFAGLYTLVELHAPGSLKGPFSPEGPLPISLGDALYFSVAVITTSGFGDVVAASHTARMLVGLEALFGVLYPAVLIARLVSLYDKD